MSKRLALKGCWSWKTFHYTTIPWRTVRRIVWGGGTDFSYILNKMVEKSNLKLNQVVVSSGHGVTYLITILTKYDGQWLYQISDLIFWIWKNRFFLQKFPPPPILSKTFEKWTFWKFFFTFFSSKNFFFVYFFFLV